MTRILVKHFFTLTIYCFTTVLAFGQADTSISESLANVTDSLLKKEIASFTKKGNSLSIKDSLFKARLFEMPILHCSDKEVHLSWSTFFSSISTFIHIYFKMDSGVKKLDHIFLVTHSHLWVRFPKDAYNGIFTSFPCSFGGGKSDKFFSAYYKAFYSHDKRRLYIYMLGGTDGNRHEVTWVIINNEYITRIFDRVD